MNLAPMIDHTILAADAGPDDVQRVVEEALTHGFASVCVNGNYVPQVAAALRDAPAKACGVVGFPLGVMKNTVKAIEASSIIKDGADEIDFVAHLPTILSRDTEALKQQFLEITRTARAVSPGVVIKVIIESAALMKDVAESEAEARIACACQAATESGCDFVKTSTGFHPAGGASVEAVRLMKKHAPDLQVKASGGIRTYDDAERMIDAGATRLGCSASVAIVQQQAGPAAGY